MSRAQQTARTAGNGLLRRRASEHSTAVAAAHAVLMYSTLPGMYCCTAGGAAFEAAAHATGSSRATPHAAGARRSSRALAARRMPRAVVEHTPHGLLLSTRRTGCY
jgi:hypothetical protein